MSTYIECEECGALAESIETWNTRQIDKRIRKQNEALKKDNYSLANELAAKRMYRGEVNKWSQIIANILRVNTEIWELLK